MEGRGGPGVRAPWRGHAAAGPGWGAAYRREGSGVVPPRATSREQSHLQVGPPCSADTSRRTKKKERVCLFPFLFGSTSSRAAG